MLQTYHDSKLLHTKAFLLSRDPTTPHRRVFVYQEIIVVTITVHAVLRHENSYEKPHTPKGDVYQIHGKVLLPRQFSTQTPTYHLEA